MTSFRVGDRVSFTIVESVELTWLPAKAAVNDEKGTIDAYVMGAETCTVKVDTGGTLTLLVSELSAVPGAVRKSTEGPTFGPFGVSTGLPPRTYEMSADAE